MVQHAAAGGYTNLWGIELGADALRLVVGAAGGQVSTRPLPVTAPAAAGWIALAIDVDYAAGTMTASVGNVPVAVLSIAPAAGVDRGTFRLSYDGSGPGNTATVLLDDVSVEARPVDTRYFRSFSARAAAGGVDLRWSFNEESAIRGYRVYREDEIDGSVVLMDVPVAGAHAVTDTDVEAGRLYRYVVGASLDDGSEIRSRETTATIPGTPPAATPSLRMEITRVYPNPFAASATMDFSLDQAAPATVRVYDVRGRYVTTLADRAFTAGSHQANWDGRDAGGQRATAGVYFLKLETRGEVLTRKVVLVR
jgi:hypothetical protein